MKRTKKKRTKKKKTMTTTTTTTPFSYFHFVRGYYFYSTVSTCPYPCSRNLDLYSDAYTSPFDHSYADYHASCCYYGYDDDHDANASAHNSRPSRPRCYSRYGSCCFDSRCCDACCCCFDLDYSCSTDYRADDSSCGSRHRCRCSADADAAFFAYSRYCFRSTCCASSACCTSCYSTLIFDSSFFRRLGSFGSTRPRRLRLVLHFSESTTKTTTTWCY